MNIQDEAMKIHHQYGTSELANYKIQLMCEKYAEEYHQNKLKNNGDIASVSDCHHSWWWKLKKTVIGTICIKCRYGCR